MSVSIMIPTRCATSPRGSDCVTVEAKTVAEAIDALTSKYPDLKNHLTARTANCGTS